MLHLDPDGDFANGRPKDQLEIGAAAAAFGRRLQLCSHMNTTGRIRAPQRL
jgi:hypothetical protein